MVGSRTQAEITVLFKEWFIPHSRAENVMAYMEQLREQKRQMRWDYEARAGYLLASSQSGKTQTVYQGYFNRFVIPQCRQSGMFDPSLDDGIIKRLQKTVVYVKVPSEYLGAFAKALLHALGDPGPYHSKDIDGLIKRAETQMASLKTELLIIDSFDNLNRALDTKAAREANRTQGTLRLMLERGMPMLFVGVPSAKTTILDEEQLAHRLDEVEFERLILPQDEKELKKYLIGLDLLMVDSGIFDELNDLEKFADPLLTAARGRLGVISNLVRDAAILALPSRTKRLGEAHLSMAVDKYLQRMPRMSSVARDDLSDLNPFTGKRVLKREVEFV